MDYVLRADALCKQYKHFKALDNLSLSIPRGAIYGLVGKNGAGKTTLIRLVCGLQSPTSGSYTLYGARHDQPAILGSRRRMGAVVETPSIYLELTARENLIEQYGLPIQEKRGPKISPWVCASGWASPWPWPETRTFSCWTNRPTAWIRRASWRSGS